MFEHNSVGQVTVTNLRNQRGNTSRILLLVLLLVVAAGGYLYYFTGLIRPVKEAAKPAPVQTSQIRKPIPPRPEQPQATTAAPAKPAGAPASQATPVPQQAKPAAAPKPAAPAAPPAKPEPAKIAKAEAPKPATAPATPKPAPQAAPAKPAAAPAPPTAAPRKDAATRKAVAKAEKPAVKRKPGAYTLLLGDFVQDKAFKEVQAKIKKSGIAPVKKSVITRSEPMNRLFVAELSDQDAAEAELQKLKKVTADAFIVAENGTYSVYAGSYLTEARLKAELQRLAAKGIKPVVRKIQLPVRVTRLMAGSYASQEEARRDVQRLKKAGLTSSVIKVGK